MTTPKILKIGLKQVVVFVVSSSEIEFFLFPKNLMIFYDNNFLWHDLFSDQLISNHVLLA